ncbi:MAG TPA: hypothetical protein PKE39_14625 [Ignavibacteria bacterium]|nr:hypothetical protein [Ignavibacteria bacterium]HMR00254.1 hypothetical protein [Ignavibacteria bacterium]
MKFLKLTLVPLILISLFIASCTDDDINKPGSGSVLIIDPTITHTDIFGNVLGGDTTDWCSNSNTLFRFNPAYPNPANDTVNLRFQLPEQDTISLMYLKTNGDTSVFIRDQVLNVGVYAVKFTASEHFIFSGVFRFIIRSKRFPEGGEYCRYYGDVQFY